MNPYLGFAALLMAGLDGVENKIHPGEAATKDLYHLPPEEDAKIPTVCHSLDQALDYLDKDRAFLTKGGVFTDAYLDAYIDLKMQEVHALPHDHAPGRVRHVLRAVSRRQRVAPGRGRLARPPLLPCTGRCATMPLTCADDPSSRCAWPRRRWPRWSLLLAAAAASAMAQDQPAGLPLPGPPVLYTDAISAAGGQGARLPHHRRRADHDRAGAAPRARPRSAPPPARRAPGRSARSTRPRSARATATRAASSSDELRREEAEPGRAAEGIQQRRARAPRRRAQLPALPRPCGRDEGGHRPQGSRHRGAPARTGQAAAAAATDRPCAARSATRGGLRPAGHDGGHGHARRPLPARQRQPREHAVGAVAPRAAARQRARLAGRPGAAARDAAAGGRQRGHHRPLRRAAQAPGRRRRAERAGARDRQPDRLARPRAGGDDRDRTADAPGPRGARARPGAGQQGTGAQPGARDQEPAGRHPRRGATAGDGADARASSPSTPRSSSTRPTGCRRWSTACWRRTARRTWWATSTSTRSASACAR